jgi:stage V sporulation protein B
MQMLDISLVPMGLQKGGYTVAEATSLYGQLSGMAGSIINLPTIVTIALSASLVPAVSSLVKKKKIEVLADLTSAALKLNLIITLPATIGLMILAEPISGLLFALPEAGEPLAWLAGGIIFAGLYHVSTGILQGLGQTLLPVIALLTGSGVKVMITYYLTPLPQWGIKGAALATVLGFMVAAFINLLFLKYNVAVRIQWWKDIFFAALSVFLMAVSVVTGYAVMEQYFSAEFTTLLTIPLGAFVYLIFIFLFGLLKKREIAILLGEDNRWNNVLDKIPFLR